MTGSPQNNPDREPDPDHEHEPHSDMSEGLLDDDQFSALFRDYRECVQVDDIIIKAAPGRAVEVDVGDDAGPSQPSLDEAQALLADRAVRGVQVRYRYDSAHWLDTLMPAAEGIRLIRIRHESAE